MLYGEITSSSPQGLYKTYYCFLIVRATQHSYTEALFKIFIADNCVHIIRMHIFVLSLGNAVPLIHLIWTVIYLYILMFFIFLKTWMTLNITKLHSVTSDCHTTIKLLNKKRLKIRCWCFIFKFIVRWLWVSISNSYHCARN